MLHLKHQSHPKHQTHLKHQSHPKHQTHLKHQSHPKFQTHPKHQTHPKPPISFPLLPTQTLRPPLTYLLHPAAFYVSFRLHFPEGWAGPRELQSSKHFCFLRIYNECPLPNGSFSGLSVAASRSRFREVYQSTSTRTNPPISRGPHFTAVTPRRCQSPTVADPSDRRHLSQRFIMYCVRGNRYQTNL